jgi:hypothetical protein
MSITRFVFGLLCACQAFGAIALDTNCGGACKAIGASTTSVTSQAVSFSGGSPTVGAAVIVGVALGTTGPFANIGITDNQGNAYSEIMKIGNPTGGQLNGFTSLWCAIAQTSSGTFTVTAAYPSGLSGNFMTLSVISYKGLSCNQDKNGAALTSSSPYNCGSFTTQNANDLLVTALGNFTSSGTITYTQPTGFTLQEQQNNGSVSELLAYADLIVSSTSTYTPTWGQSVNAASGCVLSALMAATSGGGGGQVGFPLVQ